MTIFQAHNFGNNIVTIYLMLRVCVRVCVALWRFFILLQ